LDVLDIGGLNIALEVVSGLELGACMGWINEKPYPIKIELFGLVL
jgi:F0F1-type ATP synthase assembly protein I